MNTSRRMFVKAAATAIALPTLIPASALGKNGTVAPSNRISTAVIGLGDRGPSHIGSFFGMKEIQLAAICDVFKPKLEKRLDWVKEAKPEFADCKGYQDFREILARKDIDAITIAAPENWHALMSVWAMRAGKDVYCEKALALTVAEGRAVCDSVKQTGRIFQAGIQQRSDKNFRFACELARNGYLGELKEVYVSAPGGRRKLKFPYTAVPEGLNYDLFLGPAPYKPYRENVFTYNWYFLTDYCAGWIQSWGVHHLDIALWGAPDLGKGQIEVDGTVTLLPEGDADVAFGWDITARTPKGLKMRYYADENPSPLGHGVRFIGNKGWVHVVRGGITASDPNLLSVVLKPEENRLYVSGNHMQNWADCIRSRRQPVATAEICHAATTLSLISDIAGRSEQKLIWDWTQEKFTNNVRANNSLTRPMRKGWEI